MVRRFSQYDPGQGPGQHMALIRELQSFRAQLAQLSQGEDIPEDDMADLLGILTKPLYFDVAKTVFAVLRGMTDVDERLPNDHPVLKSMVDISSALVAPPEIPLLGDNMALSVARRVMTILGVLIGRPYADMDEADHSKLAKMYTLVLELAGIEKIPLGLAELAARDPGPPPKQQAHFFHPDAGPETDSVVTATGVYNKGNTCYQNADYRVLVVSGGIRRQMAADPNRLLIAMTDVGDALFDLIEHITAGQFDESKENLRTIWTHLNKNWVQQEQMRIDYDAGVAAALAEGVPISEIAGFQEDTTTKFFAGNPVHQDASDYLESFLAEQFGSYMTVAWGHWTTTKIVCRMCFTETVSTLADPELVYHVPLPENGQSYSSHSLGLAQVLLDDMTRREAIRKRCENAACPNQAYMVDNAGPWHLKATGLRTNPNTGKVGELLVALNRWKLDAEKGRWEKDDRHVEFPQHYVAVPGWNMLCWVQAIVVHVGSYHLGHYYCIARADIDSPWIEYNDSQQKEVRWEYVQKQRWYMALLVPFGGKELRELTVSITSGRTRRPAVLAARGAYQSGVRQWAEKKSLYSAHAVQEVAKLLQQLCKQLGYELLNYPDDDTDSHPSSPSSGSSPKSDTQRQTEQRAQVEQQALALGVAAWTRIDPDASQDANLKRVSEHVALVLLGKHWHAETDDADETDDFASAAEETIAAILADGQVEVTLSTVIQTMINAQRLAVDDRRHAAALALPLPPPPTPALPQDDSINNGNDVNDGLGDNMDTSNGNGDTHMGDAPALPGKENPADQESAAAARKKQSEDEAARKRKQSDAAAAASLQKQEAYDADARKRAKAQAVMRKQATLEAAEKKQKAKENAQRHALQAENLRKGQEKDARAKSKQQQDEQLRERREAHQRKEAARKKAEEEADTEAQSEAARMAKQAEDVHQQQPEPPSDLQKCPATTTASAGKLPRHHTEQAQDADVMETDTGLQQAMRPRGPHGPQPPRPDLYDLPASSSQQPGAANDAFKQPPPQWKGPPPQSDEHISQTDTSAATSTQTSPTTSPALKRPPAPTFPFGPTRPTTVLPPQTTTAYIHAQGIRRPGAEVPDSDPTAGIDFGGTPELNLTPTPRPIHPTRSPRPSATPETPTKRTPRQSNIGGELPIRPSPNVTPVRPSPKVTPTIRQRDESAEPTPRASPSVRGETAGVDSTSSGPRGTPSDTTRSETPSDTARDRTKSKTSMLRRVGSTLGFSGSTKRKTAPKTYGTSKLRPSDSERKFYEETQHTGETQAPQPPQLQQQRPRQPSVGNRLASLFRGSTPEPGATDPASVEDDDNITVAQPTHQQRERRSSRHSLADFLGRRTGPDEGTGGRDSRTGRSDGTRTSSRMDIDSRPTTSGTGGGRTSRQDDGHESERGPSRQGDGDQGGDKDARRSKDGGGGRRSR
ncbi:hypothetical protein LTR85_008005 [Meristemomyces frigidus]|nr:hypothetical protein LTR85_008005 [Meristemomyces frigidus]